MLINIYFYNLCQSLIHQWNSQWNNEYPALHIVRPMKQAFNNSIKNSPAQQKRRKAIKLFSHKNLQNKVLLSFFSLPRYLQFNHLFSRHQARKKRKHQYFPQNTPLIRFNFRYSNFSTIKRAKQNKKKNTEKQSKKFSVQKFEQNEIFGWQMFLKLIIMKL